MTRIVMVCFLTLVLCACGCRKMRSEDGGDRELSDKDIRCSLEVADRDNRGIPRTFRVLFENRSEHNGILTLPRPVCGNRDHIEVLPALGLLVKNKMGQEGEFIYTAIDATTYAAAERIAVAAGEVISREYASSQFHTFDPRGTNHSRSFSKCVKSGNLELEMRAAIVFAASPEAEPVLAKSEPVILRCSFSQWVFPEDVEYPRGPDNGPASGVKLADEHWSWQKPFVYAEYERRIRVVGERAIVEYNWDPETGLYFLPLAPGQRTKHHDAYNRRVRELISLHGLPSSSRKDRMIPPEEFAEALDSSELRKISEFPYRPTNRIVIYWEIARGLRREGDRATQMFVIDSQHDGYAKETERRSVYIGRSSNVEDVFFIRLGQDEVQAFWADGTYMGGAWRQTVVDDPDSDRAAQEERMVKEHQ